MSASQDEHKALLWLGRKVCWGLHEGQLASWRELGVKQVVEMLLDPAAHGVQERSDRFAGIDLDSSRQAVMAWQATDQWIEAAVTTPRPLETFMEFFWSGFFAVSLRTVKPKKMMLFHMNKLGRGGLGNFRDLLHEVTLDAAMLDFLDGGRNTKARPNENYSRELFELYTVGVGHFTEDDVTAAASALTGWTVSQATGTVEFDPELHDATAQTVLGKSNVADVETTIDACLAHPATAPRIVDKLATAILGPGYLVESTEHLIGRFAEDWELRPVVRELLELGARGYRRETIMHPLGWYVAARRLPMPNPVSRQLREFFVLAGQVPLYPPNVGGFPGADAYLSTSATLARLNLATHLAQQSARPAAGLDVEMMTKDLDALAERMGLLGGFLPGTRAALNQLPPGADRLAAALASPDMSSV